MKIKKQYMRNYIIQLTVVCLISLILGSCRIEPNSVDRECIATINTFFANVGKGHAKESLQDLVASNPYIDASDSASLKLIKGFTDISQLSGEYRGYKLIKKRIFQTDILVYSYLLKFERKFYRVIFMFYRASTPVRLYKISYDDMIDTELEESLKVYMDDGK